jgi:hypothetical protein
MTRHAAAVEAMAEVAGSTKPAVDITDVVIATVPAWRH